MDYHVLTKLAEPRWLKELPPELRPVVRIMRARRGGKYVDIDKHSIINAVNKYPEYMPLLEQLGFKEKRPPLYELQRMVGMKGRIPIGIGEQDFNQLTGKMQRGNYDAYRHNVTEHVKRHRAKAQESHHWGGKRETGSLKPRRPYHPVSRPNLPKDKGSLYKVPLKQKILRNKGKALALAALGLGAAGAAGYGGYKLMSKKKDK